MSETTRESSAESADTPPSPADTPPSPAGGRRDAEPFRRLARWHCFAIGVGAALIGSVPWVITGMRLPLQNLWAVETLPDRMPIALLPFSQYAITLIFAIITVASAVAGVTARAIRARLPKGGAMLVLAGVLTTFLIAVLQTTIVVRAGLETRAESDWYLIALVAGTTLTLAAGAGVFWLIAAAPRAGALVGLTVAAIAAGSWLSALLIPMGSIPTELSSSVVGLTRWVPPILVGAAIAWCGLRSAGRMLAAVVGLLALWVAPAMLTALSASVGSRVLARYPAEMLEYGGQVLRSALFMPELALPPVILALVVAAIGLLAKRLLILRTRDVDAT